MNRFIAYSSMGIRVAKNTLVAHVFKEAIERKCIISAIACDSHDVRIRFSSSQTGLIRNWKHMLQRYLD